MKRSEMRTIMEKALRRCNNRIGPLPAADSADEMLSLLSRGRAEQHVEEAILHLEQAMRLRGVEPK